MGIGSRLREERERLNMKQEDFATACGVRRRAQSSYESDTRSPDANYLEAAAKIGVDISYVICGGERPLESTLRNLVIEDLFFCTYFELGFCDEDVQSLIKTAMSMAHEVHNRNEDVDEMAVHLVVPVRNFLNTSSKISQNIQLDSIDTNLLENLLNQLDTVARQKKIILQPKKKALAIAMLYRAFKLSGKVDLRMIKEAADLASESAV